MDNPSILAALGLDQHPFNRRLTAAGVPVSPNVQVFERGLENVLNLKLGDDLRIPVVRNALTDDPPSPDPLNEALNQARYLGSRIDALNNLAANEALLARQDAERADRRNVNPLLKPEYDPQAGLLQYMHEIFKVQ